MTLRCARLPANRRHCPSKSTGIVSCFCTREVGFAEGVGGGGQVVIHDY